MGNQKRGITQKERELMRDSNYPLLTLRAGQHFDRPWRALFRRGVGIRLRLGCSVRQSICTELGVDPEYVDQRIRSVFLDNSPLDDIDTPKLSEGQTLSLGGGMPGLVGITLNRASPFCHFRGEIGWKGDKGCTVEGSEGEITLKLFNFVAEDLVEPMLARGAIMQAVDVAALLHECALEKPGLVHLVHHAELDGREVAPADLPSALESLPGRVMVRVAWHK